ncbi:MAG: hypothetical protein HFI93_00665 [Lachnospiraceae bacterium]|nr:hypothetical protein [Lachnospiraceae bacterium]
MFELRRLEKFDEYFIKLSLRRERGVYFYRISRYSEEIHAFLLRYFEEARRTGVLVEGRIPNPDEKNLSYYEEIMGMDFRMSQDFFSDSLRKWLPRMKEAPRRDVAEALYDTFDGMKKEGKNENMRKNAYIKFMCWLYYRFERMVNRLGEEDVPKILYEGQISLYELRLLHILARAGCDVVLLQKNGDGEYGKVDPEFRYFAAREGEGGRDFPEGYGIRAIRTEWEEKQRLGRLYGPPPRWTCAVNTWCSGDIGKDLLSEERTRGTDTNLIYNAFFKIRGVENKLTWRNEWYQLQLQLKNREKPIVVVNGEIPPPTPDEIAGIRRENGRNLEQLLPGLAGNISDPSNPELKKMLVKVFYDQMLEENRKLAGNLNKLMNRGVYLLCWLKRYGPALFQNWREPKTAAFFYLGGCKNENEVFFIRYLARLPVDVILLIPDGNERFAFADPLLFEKDYEERLAVERFPQENTGAMMETAAYHAERELDTLMYQDTGMYRNFQYEKATTITLRTMYEEISILWDQEVKYRPNFSVVNGVVNIPVILGKVSGVKDGDVQGYWQELRKLATPDAFVVRQAPYIRSTDDNPIKPYVTGFIRNGRLQREKICSHEAYPYGFLREEMQKHMLDKLQLLLDRKTIRGTFENGTEYTVLAVVLNLPKELVRLMQKFDFTKKNPKLVCINASEAMYSREDAILTAFLNLVGFDIVFYTPTGYQNIEKHFNQRWIEEYQIGEYLYDLQVPGFGTMPSSNRLSWREKFFRRGS